MQPQDVAHMIELQSCCKALWNSMWFPSYFKLLLCCFLLGQTSPMSVFVYFLKLFSSFYSPYVFSYFRGFSHFLVFNDPRFRKIDISASFQATNHSDEATCICVYKSDGGCPYWSPHFLTYRVDVRRD